jgi:hypothetical protein
MMAAAAIESAILLTSMRRSPASSSVDTDSSDSRLGPFDEIGFLIFLVFIIVYASFAILALLVLCLNWRRPIWIKEDYCFSIVVWPLALIFMAVFWPFTWIRYGLRHKLKDAKSCCGIGRRRKSRTNGVELRNGDWPREGLPTYQEAQRSG